MGGCLENFSCYFNSYVSLAYILGEQSGVCRGLRKSESLAVNAEQVSIYQKAQTVKENL